MKKAILILSILALNAFAVNCRDLLNSPSSHDFTNTYHADSSYMEISDTYSNYSIATKYYYTGNNLDSIVQCTNENCSTIHYKTIEEKTESTIKTTTYFDNHIAQEEIFFIGKDSSIAYVHSPVTSHELEIDYTKISYLHNDTLYMEKRDQPEETLRKSESYFVTPDPNDENTCIQTSYDPTVKTIQKVITNTEKGFVMEENGNKMFYILVNPNSTTTIQRKVRPAVNYKNAKHFDLLGRPAQGKYTVEFLK